MGTIRLFEYGILIKEIILFQIKKTIEYHPFSEKPTEGGLKF